MVHQFMREYHDPSQTHAQHRQQVAEEMRESLEEDQAWEEWARRLYSGASLQQS